MAMYTPEDLLTLPDGDRYELIDGHLREKPMGWESSWIGGELHARLSTHCRQHNLGWVAPCDAGYQCFPNRPNLVRKPDVSFVRLGRFPNEQLPTGNARLAPDLAAEVVSPNDLAEEITEKVRDYLGAGVQLVWVVFPRARLVRVHRLDGSLAEVREDQPLNGEDVVPGFSCRVGDLLPPASAATSAG